MAFVPFFIATLACFLFATQVVESQLTAEQLSPLLDVYPNYCFFHYPRPSYMDDDAHSQLQNIINQYDGFQLRDFYQLYSILYNKAPTLSDDRRLSYLSQIAEIVYNERVRRGLSPYIAQPYSTPVNPLIQPYTSSLGTSTTAPTYTWQRRSPENIISAVVDDMSGNISGFYNKLTNSIGYYLPETSTSVKDAVHDVTHTSLADLGNKADDIAGSVSNNVSNMLNR